MPFRIELTPSISYAAHSRQRLDVCRPRDALAAPVIIFFYGGGWQSGYKQLYRYVAKALARRGYVAVVPDYRIYPEVCYPDFLDDGALVVRWVKDNIAGFGGDPKKLFLKGHSAGAHIAAMLSIDARWLGKVSLDPRRDIAGLIGVAGPYDLMPLRDEKLKTIFGDRPDTQPIYHVAPPRVAEFCLSLFLTGDKADALIGDLNERLEQDCERYGAKRARLIYWARTLRSLWPLLRRAGARAIKLGVVIESIRRFF